MALIILVRAGIYLRDQWKCGETLVWMEYDLYLENKLVMCLTSNLDPFFKSCLTCGVVKKHGRRKVNFLILNNEHAGKINPP